MPAARQSARTRQEAHTSFAARWSSPRSGKKFTSGCSRHAASACHAGARGARGGRRRRGRGRRRTAPIPQPMVLTRNDSRCATRRPEEARRRPSGAPNRRGGGSIADGCRRVDALRCCACVRTSRPTHHSGSRGRRRVTGRAGPVLAGRTVPGPARPRPNRVGRAVDGSAQDLPRRLNVRKPTAQSARVAFMAFDLL